MNLQACRWIMGKLAVLGVLIFLGEEAELLHSVGWCSVV